MGFLSGLTRLGKNLGIVGPGGLFGGGNGQPWDDQKAMLAKMKLMEAGGPGFDPASAAIRAPSPMAAPQMGAPQNSLSPFGLVANYQQNFDNMGNGDLQAMGHQALMGGTSPYLNGAYGPGGMARIDPFTGKFHGSYDRGFFSKKKGY